MLRTPYRRLAFAAVILVMAAAGVSTASGAFAADQTGTISGHYSRDGAPVTAGSVLATSDSGDTNLSAELGSSGEYEITNLPPGQYRVFFRDYTTNLAQYAHGKLDYFSADLFQVDAGGVTTVDDVALSTGTLTGTITDASGAPTSADVYVHLGDDYFNPFVTATAGADGHWQVAVPAGDYSVSFRRTSAGATVAQYAHDKASGANADKFTVAVGQTTTVDESLLGIGSISGHFTNADGTPNTVASIELDDVDGGYVASASPDENGAFSFPAALEGSYKIGFTIWDPYRQQWAHGKYDQATADAIVVTTGQDTVVDEQLLASGTINVRTKDAASGKAIKGFCVLWTTGLVCDNGTGLVTLADVPPGPQYVSVETPDGRYFNDGAPVDLPPGGTVNLSIPMRRAATIVSQVRDRATGAPVEGACVEIVGVGDTRGLGNYQPFCSDAAGKLVVGPIDPGTYNLFVHISDGVHGMQWVSSDGGVGSPEQASVVRAKTGVVLPIPTIMMDKAGTIAGTITGTGGQPLLYAGVYLATFHPGVGGGIGVMTDSDGHYTFDGLGPYDWPLFLAHFDYAPQWSGGVANRLLATPVQVHEGQTTAYDVQLTKGVTVTGTITNSAGTPLEGGYILANNVDTSDIMSSAWFDNGQFTLHVLGPQMVKLNVQGGLNGGSEWYDSWYVDATDMAHATVVTVPSDGSLTIDIVARLST